MAAHPALLASLDQDLVIWERIGCLIDYDMYVAAPPFIASIFGPKSGHPECTPAGAFTVQPPNSTSLNLTRTQTQPRTL